MAGVFLTLGVAVRRLGLALTAVFLAVIVLGDLEHECFRVRDGVARASHPILARSGGLEASSPRHCLSCFWEQGAVHVGAVPPLAVALPAFRASRPTPLARAEAAAALPLRASRAPPVYASALA